MQDSALGSTVALCLAKPWPAKLCAANVSADKLSAGMLMQQTRLTWFVVELNPSAANPCAACRCGSRAAGSDRRLGGCALPGSGWGHSNRAGEEACRLDSDCRPRGRAGDVHRDAACPAP